MNRSTRVSISVATLAALALTIGSVAIAEPRAVVRSSPGCAMRAAKGVEKCETFEKREKAIAGLYEKYEDEFAAIHEKHEGRIAELAEKIESLEREIEEISTADKPDLGKLESRLKEISDLRFERTKLRFRMHKEARGVVAEGDRAALDRHFAMGVGCCGGIGMQATYRPGRADGKFELKACCPHGMSGHSAGKVDFKRCCPALKGHTSMSGPRVMFVGEKDGRAEVQILGDTHGALGCAPSTIDAEHIEVLLDEEKDGVRRVKVVVDGEDGEGKHFDIMLDDEDLDGDVREIIKETHRAPADEVDTFLWHERGGSSGPF